MAREHNRRQINIVRERTPELPARSRQLRTFGSVSTANPTGTGTMPRLSTVAKPS